MDGAGDVPQRGAVVEILVAERRACVRVADVRRGRPVHDQRLAYRRVPGADPTLVVFHTAARAPTRVDSRRHRGIWYRHGRRRAGDRYWDLDLFAGQTSPLCRRRVE